MTINDIDIWRGLVNKSATLTDLSERVGRGNVKRLGE